jgi:hypothetical protein
MAFATESSPTISIQPRPVVAESGVLLLPDRTNVYFNFLSAASTDSN